MSSASIPTESGLRELNALRTLAQKTEALPDDGTPPLIRQLAAVAVEEILAGALYIGDTHLEAQLPHVNRTTTESMIDELMATDPAFAALFKESNGDFTWPIRELSPWTKTSLRLKNGTENRLEDALRKSGVAHRVLFVSAQNTNHVLRSAIVDATLRCFFEHHHSDSQKKFELWPDSFTELCDDPSAAIREITNSPQSLFAVVEDGSFPANLEPSPAFEASCAHVPVSGRFYPDHDSNGGTVAIQIDGHPSRITSKIAPPAPKTSSAAHMYTQSNLPPLPLRRP